MVYCMKIDGDDRYVEIPIRDYNVEKDENIRKQLKARIIEEDGAVDVIFITSVETARKYHQAASDFYSCIKDFNGIYTSLPYDKTWEPDEMFYIIQGLMKIYMEAMNLPEIEHTEKAKYDFSEQIGNRAVNFSNEYEVYWQIFNPYCQNFCENSDSFEISDEACTTTLTDDLSDILTDLSLGAGAYEAGLVCEALFQWKFSLVSHYGHHIRNAINAMGDAWEKSVR